MSETFAYIAMIRPAEDRGGQPGAWGGGSAARWRRRRNAMKPVVEIACHAVGRSLVDQLERAQRLFGDCVSDQWIPLRMANGLQLQVDIQRRPAKVLGIQPLDPQDRRYRSIPKPGEICKGQEIFFAVDIQPETMLGDISDFHD
jgi:hypothetical protein